MPGRYAIVEEPEALEVVDEDVYHPDQSVREINSSVRSLEPILAGPIGLKTVFYDPRWSPNQRKCCLAVLITVSCFCLAILIALFVGLGKVLSYINRMEKMKQSGLYMIPDLEQEDLTSFVYSPSNKTSWNHHYIREISHELEKYSGQSEEYEDCKPNTNASSPEKLCRFHVNTVLKGNCTKDNDFGYYVGSPCLLFQFRNLDGHDWAPNLDRSVPGSVVGRPGNEKVDLTGNNLPIICSTKVGRYYRPRHALKLDTDYKVYPKEGFDLGFIPPRTTERTKKKTYNPLVMVELVEPHKKFSTAEITCEITGAVTNLKTFKGTKSIEFEFDSALQEADSALENQ